MIGEALSKTKMLNQAILSSKNSLTINHKAKILKKKQTNITNLKKNKESGINSNKATAKGWIPSIEQSPLTQRAEA